MVTDSMEPENFHTCLAAQFLHCILFLSVRVTRGDIFNFILFGLTLKVDARIFHKLFLANAPII